jgi:hypothetical protein
MRALAGLASALLVITVSATATPAYVGDVPPAIPSR